MKDGAFLSAFECLGPDLNSASAEELDAHRAQANRALARLDDGFMYNVDLIRYPSVDYPSARFPIRSARCSITSARFTTRPEGQHFETRCVLTITYRPPADAQTRIAGVFLSGTPKRADWRRQLEWFKQRLREFDDAISPVWKLTPLEMPALLSHITSCINGRMCQVAAPTTPTSLDAVLGNQDFIAGLQAARRRPAHPRGRAGRLSALLARRAGRLPERTADLLPLLDSRDSGGPRTSISQLAVYRRNWFQKRQGLRGVISEHFGSGTGAAFQNQHALRMAADADDAITEAEGGEVRYLLRHAKVIITEDRRRRRRRNRAADLQGLPEHGLRSAHRDHQRRRGLARLDPGHGWYDVRQPLVSTQQPRRHPAADQHLAGARDQSVPLLPEGHAGALLRRDHRQHAVALQSPCRRYRPHWNLSVRPGAARASRWAPSRPTSARSRRPGLLHGQGLFRLRPDQGARRPASRSRRGGGAAAAAGAHRRPDRPHEASGLLEDWIALQERQAHAATSARRFTARSNSVAEAPAEQRTISNLITQVQDTAVRDGLSAVLARGTARALSRRRS